MDSNFISIKLLIKDDLKKQEIINNVINFFNDTQLIVEDLGDNIFIDINNIYTIDALEELLDEILIENTKTFRYSINKYEIGKKYPYNITINNKGKKIITKNKTKISFLKI